MHEKIALTIQKIREDLKDIRYYYSKQKIFDSNLKIVVQSSVVEKVNRYNEAVKNAPARLYDVYVSLYVQNNTQEALAFDWDFSPEYIKLLNRQLCEFFLRTMS